MLGHTCEMACSKFHANRLRIEREIDEKHALQIYQNNCVLDKFILYSTGIVETLNIIKQQLMDRF